MQSQAAIHFSICILNPLIWWIRQKSLRCLATTCSSSNFQTVNAEVFIHLKCASEVSEQGIVMLQIPVYSVSCMDLPWHRAWYLPWQGPSIWRTAGWIVAPSSSVTTGGEMEWSAPPGGADGCASQEGGRGRALQEGGGVAPPSDPPSGSSLRSWTPGEDVEQL